MGREARAIDNRNAIDLKENAVAIADHKRPRVESRAATRRISIGRKEEPQMKANLTGAIATVLLMTAATFAQTFTRETPIYEDDVPVVVREVFKSAYPQASVDRYIKVEVDGVPFYRVESVEASSHRKILYDQNGTVSRIAERIVVADLPAGAQQVIPEKYPQSIISSAERVAKAGQVTYEVNLKQDAKVFHLQFDAEGKLTAAREVKIDIVLTRSPF